MSTDDVDLSTVAEDEETARAQIDKMEEEGPPEDLADCPTGKAMSLSFGGVEDEEGPARQMGPSSLRHHADGSVEVQGEKVDNPEDYKAEQSMGDEAENLGLDKGAKREATKARTPRASRIRRPSSGDASAEGGDSESDGSEGDESESQQAESETADTS